MNRPSSNSEWNMLGIHINYAWSMVCLEYVWNIFGVCMGCVKLWIQRSMLLTYVCGICMGYTCNISNVLGIGMEYVRSDILWVEYVRSMCGI